MDYSLVSNVINEYKNSSAHEQEKEIVSILFDSSLYLEMSEEERQRLLNYLVTSYFDPALGNNSMVFRKSNLNSPSS
jgi:hypothetical protein